MQVTVCKWEGDGGLKVLGVWELGGGGSEVQSSVVRGVKEGRRGKAGREFRFPTA